MNRARRTPLGPPTARRWRFLSAAAVVALLAVAFVPAVALANDAHLTITKTPDQGTVDVGATIGAGVGTAGVLSQRGKDINLSQGQQLRIRTAGDVQIQ